MPPVEAPYGAWPSPLSARDAVTALAERRTPRVDGTTLWWLEARPVDGGRLTLVRRDEDAAAVDVSAPGDNVRTRFQEYGGGEYAVGDDIAVWVEFGDQRVRRAEAGETHVITPECDGAVRWSCFRIDPTHRRILCLREDLRDPDHEPVAAIVSLALDGPNDDFGVELVAGRRRAPGEPDDDDPDSAPDFLSDPILSADGTRIAWVSWNHPRMTWEGSWLKVGTLGPEGVDDVQLVAGGPDESVEQPTWLDDGRLVFLSDRTGWSNLYLWDGSDVTPLCADEHEFGGPRWVPDLRSYAVLPGGDLVTTRIVDGRQQLCVVGVGTGDLREVPSPVTGVQDLCAFGEHHVVCRANQVDRTVDVVTVDLRDGSTTAVVDEEPPDAGYVSPLESMSWAGSGGDTAYGIFYPPANAEARAPEGTLPPLVVTLHGGPTAWSPPSYSMWRTFWTSRGFAILDVNYGGSTGFGRAYRKRLEGTWGIVDVEDAVAGVRMLADRGLVDGEKVGITGGSAGGYTTLAAITFTDAFAAGASHFGVSDLALLAEETHKLESRYLNGLVAPWPEGREVYAERSPIHHIDRLATPLILLQGTDDKVVPPNQAEVMADALRARGLPVALVMFEGEGHGFRDAANKARALECELSFYGQVFGFTPAGDIEPVAVENLPSR